MTTRIAILAVIGTAALALGWMVWDDERIKKHNLELASPRPSNAAAAGDPNRLALLKTQPPEIDNVFHFLKLPFSVTNTTSSTLLSLFGLSAQLLTTKPLVDASAGVVGNLKQNETAYGYANFMKTKDLNLHFKCRISQVLD
jgi:hypothetical protein